MEIDINFGGLAEAVRRMRELEQATAGVARQARSIGGGAGGAGAGPMARAAAAQSGLASALAGGDPNTIFDAQVRAARAQQSVERAQRLLQGSTLGQRVSNLISTTRFGAGGVMPLVGRTAAALGGEAMAGPIGMAAAAVTGFAQVMQSATQTVGEFRRAATMTGGTAGETARIAAMGVAPGQQAGAAAGLREALSSDPMAISLAARNLGIGPQMMRGTGQVNEAKLLDLTLKRLRGLIAEGRALEALETARALHLDGYMDELMVSQRVFNARQADANLQARIMEDNGSNFRDLASQSSRLQESFSSLGIAFAGTFAPMLDRLAGGLADMVNAGANFLNWIQPLTQWLQEQGPLGQLGKIPEFFHPGGKDDATKENTEALNENNRILKQGIMGGGPLARGAVPPSLRGRMLDEAIANQRLRLGVFGN